MPRPHHDETHVHLHIDGPINVNVSGGDNAEILCLLKTIASRQISFGESLMATADDILKVATEGKTVGESAAALLVKLKAAIDAAGGDKAKIDEAFAALTGNKTALEEAILANTPQEP